MMGGKIIDNTIEAQEEYGYLYGAEYIVLTAKELNELKQGKCYATTVNDEYVVFISVKQS